MICPDCKSATKTNYASNKPFEYCVNCKVEVFPTADSYNDRVIHIDPNGPPVYLPIGTPSDKDLNSAIDQAPIDVLDSFGFPTDPFRYMFIDDIDEVDDVADLGDD